MYVHNLPRRIQIGLSKLERVAKRIGWQNGSGGKRNGWQTERVAADCSVLGDYPLDRVRPEDIQRWLLGIRAKDGGIATTSTMQNYLNRLREVFEVAVLEGHIRVNPCHKSLVKAPKGRRSRQPVALTPEQCAQLLKWAGKYDNWLRTRPGCPYMGHQPYIALALATGCRSGELTALRWDEHIDLATGTVEVVANHWRGKVGTRKTGRRDTLYLAPGLTKLLGRHWQRMQQESTPTQLASGLVFPARNGGYSTARPKKALLWCCRQAGLPRMVPHDLRHTAATLWNRVASRRVAQLAIGHFDDEVHDRYTHPYEDEFLAGSNAVAGLIGLEAQ